MKCMRCGKETYDSTTTEAIDNGTGVLVIRNVPCHKCVECGEIMYTGDVVQVIEKYTKDFQNMMQEVSVIDYQKVA